MQITNQQIKGYVMLCNEGKIDRTLRVALGLGLIAYGVVDANYIVAAIGAIPLITGAVGVCPLYLIFKFDTNCKKD